MKKILFSALGLMVMGACTTTTPKYVINGTAEGLNDGYAYILQYQNRQYDTLATAPIKDGKFQLTGTANELTTAYLAVGDQKKMFFLENATYTANLSDTTGANALNVCGTPNQEVLAAYGVLSDSIQRMSAGLEEQYMAAAQEKDEAKMKEVLATYEEVENTAETMQTDFVKANGESPVAAYIIMSISYNMDLDQLKAANENLGEAAKACPYGQKIADRIAKLEAVAIGQTAPDFTLNTPEGDSLSLSDIKGKAKIVDFWASWCNPCRRANPGVVELFKEFHDQGLEILGVSLDQDKEAWTKAIADDNLTWNHVSDLQGWNNAAAQLYGVNSIPHILVLDENNVIMARNLHGDELKAKIAELLK